MRISDWSSDVCSSDLLRQPLPQPHEEVEAAGEGRPTPSVHRDGRQGRGFHRSADRGRSCRGEAFGAGEHYRRCGGAGYREGDRAALAILGRLDEGTALDAPSPGTAAPGAARRRVRSEEHTSELQSLMRVTYAVFCLKTKNEDIHT